MDTKAMREQLVASVSVLVRFLVRRRDYGVGGGGGGGKLRGAMMLVRGLRGLE
jgi:hypothetical protein